MKTRLARLSILSACLAVTSIRATTTASAENWPQYLGPNRNSTSAESGISRQWPDSGPQVLWKLPVGRGFGGPAIHDGKVYLLDRDDSVGETLRCINLEDGRELWKYSYDAPGAVMFPGSRSVPTIDGEHVYICGHNGDLHCISITSQKPVWKANVWADFGGQPPFQRGSDDENKLGKVVGIDPKSGQVLWEYDKWNCHISVASAVDAGENRLLIVGGYELGATMIQIEKSDKGLVAKELFVTEDFGDQTKPPILYDGHFYAQYGTNNRRDGLVCMNMKGEIMWKTGRDPNFNKGSMILVDGVILATDGEKSLYVIAPDPKEFKALQSAKLLGEGGGDNSGIAGRIGGTTQNWAPIALSNGKLLIRDQTEMKCVQVGP